MTPVIVYIIAQIIIIAIALPVVYFTIGKRINDQLKSISEIGDRVGYQARVVDSTAASFMQNHEKWLKEIDIDNVRNRVHDTVSDQIIKVEQKRIDTFLDGCNDDVNHSIEVMQKKGESALAEMKAKVSAELQQSLIADQNLSAAVKELAAAKIALEKKRIDERLQELTRDDSILTPIFVKHRDIGKFMTYIESKGDEIAFHVRHYALIPVTLNDSDELFKFPDPECVDDVCGTSENGKITSVESIRLKAFQLVRANGSAYWRYSRVSYRFQFAQPMTWSEVHRVYSRYRFFNNFTDLCHELGV